MSMNGIAQFSKNLKTLMATERFKKADDGDRMRLGGTLMRSSYGAAWGGKVKELKSRDA